jgi:hypothetical protein
MSNTVTLRKWLAAFGLGIGLLATLVVSSGLFAPGAEAASDKGAGISAGVSAEASPTRTPRPIRLRPWLQFGHAEPGGTAHYRQLLFNHLSQNTDVRLWGGSLQGWDVDVSPTSTVALPGYANVVTVTVHVPMDPAHRVDLERTRAVITGTETFTTTAYLVTITRRDPFADLAEGHWADDSVQYLVDQGVISGYADGSFHPNENVTRAQFAKMLVAGMGWAIQTPQSPTFSDVQPDYWAYGYIETAAAHGVIAGYSDGTFRPSASVTRAQVAKMIFTARAWTLESLSVTNFNDVNAGDWAYNYVQAISSAGAMSGYADNSFHPNAPATRAQIAKILTYSLFSDPNN